MFRPIPQRDNTIEAVATAATVGLARAGDQEALRELYEQHHRRIYNLVYRMVGRREDAIDLTSEVFLRAFQNLKHLKTDEAFGAWLRRVAVNLCLDFTKRKAPYTVSIDVADSDDDSRRPPELMDNSRGPDQLMVTGELSERVHLALSQLTPNHRAVILLHHLDGKEVKEIAEIMDCSEGTIKSRLARARENMKMLLEDYVKS